MTRLLVLALPLSALAGDPVPAHVAADECAQESGFLHCVEARDGTLDCDCITLWEGAKPSHAYFVKVDIETTTQADTGQALLAFDLAGEPATLWFDAAAPSCDYDATRAELERTAAAADGVLVHELGHWLGAARERGEVLGSDF